MNEPKKDAEKKPGIRPEAFDGYDCEPREEKSPAYYEAALPDHLRELLKQSDKQGLQG